MSAAEQGSSNESLVVQNEGGHTRRLGRAGAKLVERLAAEGNSDTSIAKALKIHRETFRIIRKRQPEIDEALARGRASLEDELTDILMAHAREGHVVAAIYLTKARCGWREGDVPPGQQVTNNTQVNIVIPPPMSDEEFCRLVGA